MAERDASTVRRQASFWRGLWVSILAALVAGPGSGTPVSAQVSMEYDLKAVFLYNLANFVVWPEAAYDSPESPFVIAVLGKDPFGRVLDDVVVNEYIGKHPIEIRRLSRHDDVSGCHLLFVAESESRRVPEILGRVRGRPVLTVADRPGFVDAGGMVGIERRSDQLQLSVNIAAVRAADLVVSSKLLEVAVVVETEPSSP